MPGHDDADQHRHRYQPPHNQAHQIPTIGKFREEKEARQNAAAQYGDDELQDGDSNALDQSKQLQNGDRSANTQEEHRTISDGSDGQQPLDTSEVDAATTDPRARRKQLRKRKDERAEREVTDPATHLPIRISDLTSAALEEVPENDEPWGPTSRTATGLDNKRKSEKQLEAEKDELQRGHDAMRTLFPPPDFEEIKRELTSINKLGMTVGLGGAAIILLVLFALERLLDFQSLASSASGRLGVSSRNASSIVWLVLAACSVGAIAALILGVRDWVAKKVDSLWDAEVWHANDKNTFHKASHHETETVSWLNSLIGSVWPLINPDLFLSLADTLEDVMQASLPSMVRMVSVNDIGQGKHNVRILGVKWLPTGAASQSVTEDGTIKNEDHQSNDRTVPGEGQVDDGGDNDPNASGNRSSGDHTQQEDDGSQQQIAEGLEAEEGDFINLEVAFAYRSRSDRRTIKDRARDMHLYMAFYLPGNIKLPVWVDLRGIVGTMRLRLQLCPDPPFFSLCTLTFLGQPKVDLSCTPLSKHAVNIMDVPFISNFVQSAVDAAMAQYVAPKSLNLDLKDMLAGDDFKKDVGGRGVIVVHIKRGYDFKTGDPGIPLITDGSSDPYVSVGWAKFGKALWSTRLLLHEMEPWWDETAYVLVTQEELNVSERLRVQLWDSDRMTADDDLGRIEVDLKELMKREESTGKMWDRSDGFRALKKGGNMPGKLEWSVGYFSKASLQDCQLQKQTFDTNIRSMDALEEKVDQICERKLREAQTKEGRHKSEADELEQQKAQEMRSMQDSMIISSPPPEGYPSGIFSIQIHQIIGLQLQRISKTEADRDREGSAEEEEGDGLPSAYCTVIINHRKVFKTRTKPKNAKPFYNASTERFIADWQNAEVFVSVRDARVKEDDALLGIVHLPLGDVFKERSQVNGFYPLASGVGFGRIRLSMVWRSVQLQLPRNLLGWQYGTVEVKPSISGMEGLPHDLQELKLRFYSDLSSGKMYPSKEDHGWKTKNGQSLRLATHQRYGSCLALEFRHNGVLKDKTAAFAVLWLKELVDDEEQEVTVTVWKGDFERATKNALPDCGEKVGTLKLNLTFWSGLGAAHSGWARKDANVRDVVEVLEAARDNLEEMQHEKEAGIVESNVSDSSSDEEPSQDHSGKAGPIGKVKDLKHQHDTLKRHNRGIMQWRAPRTAQWVAHKFDHTESRIEGLFKHHTSGGDIETEV